MNFKNILTISLSFLFAIGLILTAVIYGLQFNNSSKIDNISIRTLSGDESLMDDIELHGTIGSTSYFDYSYIDYEFTDFTVDVSGNLKTENNSYKMKDSEYRTMVSPNNFAIDFNAIIPRDNPGELIGKDEYDPNVNVYHADTFTPYFNLARTMVYWDTFLLIKPDYYVQCDEENFLEYAKYSDEAGEDFDSVFVKTYNTENVISNTENLTAKIGDYYYLVLPTLSGAVGTNGIYKVQVGDAISLFFGDYIEGTMSSREDDVIKESKSLYEKIADIEINFEGENNKIVEKMFEHDGKLILLSTQKENLNKANIYLNTFDIENNVFEEEIYLGKFDTQYLEFFSNDDFVTIQSDSAYITFNLQGEELNKTSVLDLPMTEEVYFSNGKLYIYAVYDRNKDQRLDPSLVNLTAINMIFVYEKDELKYLGELQTNAYQDYRNESYSNKNPRTVMYVSFGEK